VTRGRRWAGRLADDLAQIDRSKEYECLPVISRQFLSGIALSSERHRTTAERDEDDDGEQAANG
jgi:hypothetical protein